MEVLRRAILVLIVVDPVPLPRVIEWKDALRKGDDELREQVEVILEEGRNFSSKVLSSGQKMGHQALLDFLGRCTPTRHSFHVEQRVILELFCFVSCCLGVAQLFL